MGMWKPLKKMTHCSGRVIEMTLPLDLVLGDTGPEQANDDCPYEYVEWIRDSLYHAHEHRCETL